MTKNKEVLDSTSTTKRDDLDYSDLTFGNLTNERTSLEKRSHYSRSIGSDDRLSVISGQILEQSKDIERNHDVTAALLSKSQRIVIDDRYRRFALTILFIMVFLDSGNVQVLVPNYALMADVGNHPDAFPSTSPLGFSAATYFIPMSTLIGLTAANIVVPALSDRCGRRPILLMNLFGGCFATLLKYFLRKNFWYFCGASFLNGIFASTLSVGISYISDLFPGDPKKADNAMSIGSMIYFLGRTSGGMLAVAMPRHLFLPLIPSATLTFIGGMIGYFMLPEPRKWNIVRPRQANASRPKRVASQDRDATSQTGSEPSHSEHTGASQEEEEEALDKWTAWTVIIGSLFNNMGACGFLPFAVSPVMYNHFYGNFVREGIEPILKEQGLKWFYSFLAVAALPAAIAMPVLFSKLGPAKCCSVSNILSAGILACLLYIVTFEATQMTLILYALTVYVGVPIVAFSCISISPMLNRISTHNTRGFLQGLNMATVDGSSAVMPFLYGLMTDNFSQDVAIWTAVGCSVIAAMVYAGLAFDRRFAATSFDEDNEEASDFGGSRKSLVEDLFVNEDQILDRILVGDYVRPSDLYRLNQQRMDRGESLVTVPVGNYDREMDSLGRKEMLHEFGVIRDVLVRKLAAISANAEAKNALATELNLQLESKHEDDTLVEEEMGRWITEYLQVSGWKVREAAPLMKLVVATSFPPLVRANESEDDINFSGASVTSETVEGYLMKLIKTVNECIHTEKSRDVLLDVDNVEGPLVAQRKNRGASFLQRFGGSSLKFRKKLTKSEGQVFSV